MENIFLYSLAFLLVFLVGFAFVGKTWSSNTAQFLFANGSLSLIGSGSAIGSHWIWAIALFVGQAAAYNWGTIGLIWFLGFNTLSLLIVGYLVSRIRDLYPNGFSLTSYVKENFSKRISALYQFEFLVVATGAVLLAFTAIGKLWAFAGLGTVIDPSYASLIVGLITLGFTIKGGIRTSVLTGTVQTMLWLVFSAITGYYLLSSDLPILSSGKNDLASIADVKFLTTFAGAYLITILTSSSGHGHLWQKAFSMPKQNIMPSFTIGAVFFAIILGVFLSLATFAFANGLAVATPDTSALAALTHLMGTGIFVLFGILFVSQTSTVIDSSMNYVASLVTLEWLGKDQVWMSRVIMAVFLIVAWVISKAQLEIWTIMMLMGAVRTVMFVPLVLHIFKVDLKEKLIFTVSVITIPCAFALAWIAKMDKLPVFDLYSAVVAILIPMSVYTLLHLKKKYSTQ